MCFVGQNRVSRFVDSDGSPSRTRTALAFDLNSNYSSAMTNAQPVSSFLVYNDGQREELFRSIQSGSWRFWNKEGCFEKYNPIKGRKTRRGLGLIVDLFIPKSTRERFENFPVFFIRQSAKPNLLSPWQRRLEADLESDRAGVRKRKNNDGSEKNAIATRKRRKMEKLAYEVEEKSSLPAYIPPASLEQDIYYPDRVSDAAFRPKNSSERSSCRVTPVVSPYLLNYNLCWRTLRWLLTQGVILLHIRFAVEFEVYPILRRYVTDNNERRKLAKDRSSNLCQKLLNNRCVKTDGRTDGRTD